MLPIYTSPYFSDSPSHGLHVAIPYLPTFTRDHPHSASSILLHPYYTCDLIICQVRPYPFLSKQQSTNTCPKKKRYVHPKQFHPSLNRPVVFDLRAFRIGQGISGLQLKLVLKNIALHSKP